MFENGPELSARAVPRQAHSASKMAKFVRNASRRAQIARICACGTQHPVFSPAITAWRWPRERLGRERWTSRTTEMAKCKARRTQTRTLWRRLGAVRHTQPRARELASRPLQPTCHFISTHADQTAADDVRKDGGGLEYEFAAGALFGLTPLHPARSVPLMRRVSWQEQPFVRPQAVPRSGQECLDDRK